MRPANLAAQCRAQQRITGRADAEVMLCLPGRSPTGERVRLAGRHGGPYGEVMCLNAVGETVAMFRADQVLAWMGRKALVPPSVDEVKDA